MSAFDYVIGLISIVSSLALTHLVASFVGLLRRGRTIGFSLQHAVWMWTASATTVGNWGSNWSMHDVRVWPAWVVLGSLVLTVGQYAFCVFVSPEPSRDERVDLATFHRDEGPLYVGAYIILTLLALGSNVLSMNSYSAWLRDSVFCLVGLLLALASLRGPQWLRLTASSLVAVQSTVFMVLAVQIVSR